MKFRSYIFFCAMLACLLSGSQLMAQSQTDFTVTATADTTQIRIGEPVNVLFTAKVPMGNVKVAFPNLPDSLHHLEITARSPIDTTGSDANQRLFRQTITLTSFDSGRWELPPLKFEVYSLSTNAADSAYTESVFIDVQTVAVDTTKPFKPIKPLRSVAWNILDYWPYLLGTIVLIAFIILYFAYWRKKKTPLPPPPPKPAKSPYQIAMEELEQLAAAKPWHQDVKLYYTQLTDILRQYFEQQFHIAAQEQTTAELLQNIKPVTVLNQQRDKLQAILTLADLAKFAKLQPAPHEHEECLQKAIAVVEWTKPAATAAAPTDSPNQT